ESFYINNCTLIRGKTRINLEVDPPPDLAIEIDITNRTLFNNYQALGVPELWRYNGERLQINVLQNGKYITTDKSNIFPQFNLVKKIPEILKSAQIIGSAKALKEFRKWVKEIV
ncbi:MAG: Uma2 family endonuclease, partial [Crocosphaera sp.]